GNLTIGVNPAVKIVDAQNLDRGIAAIGQCRGGDRDRYPGGQCRRADKRGRLTKYSSHTRLAPLCSCCRNLLVGAAPAPHARPSVTRDTLRVTVLPNTR